MGFASLVAAVIAALASIVPLTGPALAFLPFVASVGLGVVALRRQRQPRAASRAGSVRRRPRAGLHRHARRCTAIGRNLPPAFVPPATPGQQDKLGL